MEINMRKANINDEEAIINLVKVSNWIYCKT